MQLAYLKFIDMNENTKSAVVSPEWFNRAIEHSGTSDYFNHGGVNLHYLNWNRDDSKEKPTLVFAHGFRGHARWWAFVAPFFTEYYHVYALDFSGMGDSDDSPVYSPDSHAEEILAFIEHLGVPSVTVVAHSFGGGRTFRAAAKQPAMFKQIIAVDSHITFEDDDIGIDPSPQNKTKCYESLNDGLLRFRLTPKQASEENYLVEYIGRNSLKAMGKQWTWKFDPKLLVEKVTSTNGAEILGKITCPVDYIYAGDSVVVSRERANRIFDSLANPGRFICVPGGHHHLMVSHPVTLISTLQALLQ